MTWKRAAGLSALWLAGAIASLAIVFAFTNLHPDGLIPGLSYSNNGTAPLAVIGLAIAGIAGVIHRTWKIPALAWVVIITSWCLLALVIETFPIGFSP